MPKPLRPLTPELSPAHRLGAQLRELRGKSGHSQKSLGDMVHVSKSMIGAIEMGQRISTAEVIKVCDEELGASGVLCELWRAAAAARPHVGRPPKSVFAAAPIDTASSTDLSPLGRAIEHVERVLSVRIDRVGAVHGFASFGARTDRATWIRIEHARVDEIGARGWGGAEAAAALRGVAAPPWIGTLTWRGREPDVLWRADEVTLIQDPPVETRATLSTAPELSTAWWCTWNTSLDALAAARSARRAVFDRHLITAEHVASVIEAVWPGRIDTCVTEWTCAHGQLTWRKLAAPSCWILGWNGYGLAPRGLDAATLWSRSLAVPQVAAQIWRERRTDLESPTGRVMALYCLARILGSMHGPADPLYDLADAEASALLRRYFGVA